MRSFFLGTFFFAFLCGITEAKTFKSQFIRFELPPNWDCKQEELDWVCQPDNLAERNEVILVVVTKPVDNVDDNFDRYENVLKTPKNMRDLLGNSYQSEIKYTRRLTILDHVWVDSLHFGSEIPGFYTRYVASILEKVAGLLTYSIAESAYPKWADIMDRLVKTTKLQFDPKAFAELKDKGVSPLLGNKGRGRRLPPPIEELGGESKEEGDSSTGLFIGFLILVVGGYFYYRVKKKKNQQS